MARIDDVTTYNPFGWRLRELAEPTTSAERRGELVEELVSWEAEELAHGCRHLTVEHGDPCELDASRLLSTLYDRLSGFAASAAWARMRGAAGYVTVTVHGSGADEADEAVGALRAIAEELNPGDWTVTHTAFPTSIVAA